MLPSADPIDALVACLQSFVFDFVARQKLGGTSLKYFTMRQLTLLPPETFMKSCPWSPSEELATWLRPRVLKLTYTAWDLAPFAKDLGYEGPPFLWDEEQRFWLRAELDAAFFHLYGVGYDDVGYIMETFPIVKRKDEKAHNGTYRTKETILDIYGRMQRAIDTGQPYQTVLDPPPAVSYVAPPPRTQPAWNKNDIAALPDAAWARPMLQPRAETGAALAAVLKTLAAPTPARTIRLAAILMLEPRLAVASFEAENGATWRRLIGSEADALPAGVVSFVPASNRDWRAAVRHFRGNEMLIEDFATNTWAPGPGLNAIETDGWPDGRARMIMNLLRQRGEREIVQRLPDTHQRWIHAEAA